MPHLGQYPKKIICIFSLFISTTPKATTTTTKTKKIITKKIIREITQQLYRNLLSEWEPLDGFFDGFYGNKLTKYTLEMEKKLIWKMLQFYFPFSPLLEFSSSFSFFTHMPWPSTIESHHFTHILHAVSEGIFFSLSLCSINCTLVKQFW